MKQYLIKFKREDGGFPYLMLISESEKKLVEMLADIETDSITTKWYVINKLKFTIEEKHAG